MGKRLLFLKISFVKFTCASHIPTFPSFFFQLYYFLVLAKSYFQTIPQKLKVEHKPICVVKIYNWAKFIISSLIHACLVVRATSV